MTTPYRDPGFEQSETYFRFLDTNGVTSEYIYAGSVKRAAKTLNEFFTTADLSSTAQVDRIMEALRPTITARSSFNSIRCALMAYVKMLNTNFDGLFADRPAASSPPASDLDLTLPPDRVRQEVYRFIRDTVASREVKALYEYHCQICGHGVQIAPGKYYAEAHHIRPLGRRHRGLDQRDNLICVCPNHHAQLDYFGTSLTIAQLKLSSHYINPTYVDYHNERVTHEI